MKKILLLDTLSTIHVGNGALLENTIELCKKAYGDDCTFDIITMDIKTNLLKYEKTQLFEPIFGNFWSNKRSKTGKVIWYLGAVVFILIHIINIKTIKISPKYLMFKKRQKRTLEAIQRCDLSVSCGGEIIGDTFYQALPLWMFSYWLSASLGKKFALFPQSVGPLNNRINRWMVFKALNKSDILCGRDMSSYETLLSLGIKPNKVLFMPDVAFQQKCGKANLADYFDSNLASKKKTIGITISNPPFRELGKKADFVKSISEQVLLLENKSKYKVLIMPSNYILNGTSRDYQLCLDLMHSLANNIEVNILQNRPYFPEEYSAILSQLDVFVSTRMHVGILASTMLTPTIAINTQYKVRGYMRNIDMEDNCVEYEDLNKINSLLELILSNREDYVARLSKGVEKVRKMHDELVERLQSI